MLYIYEDLDRLDDEFAGEVIHLLCDERKKKMQNIKNPSVQNQSIVAYLLLRYALANEYKICEPVTFEYSKHGKPYLVDFENIHFNLSHCKSAAACAISDYELGVDIQQIGTVKDSLAKRVLTTDEYNEFVKADNPDEFFCRLWTIKEAYIKKTGQGIKDLFNLSVDDTSFTIYRGHDYYCTASLPNMEINKITMEELIK